MMTEEKLDNLFESARNARIDTSQEEVTRWLTTAAVTAVSAGAAATGFKLLLTKKALIMTIGTIGVASIAVVSTVIFPATENPANPGNKNVITYASGAENDTPAESTFYAETQVFEENPATENPATETPSGNLPMESCMPYSPQHYTVVEVPTNVPVMGISYIPANTVGPVMGVNYVPLAQGLYSKEDSLKTKATEIKVQPFSMLHIDGVFDVIITQGPQEKVVVQSEQADAVQAVNDGETLVITSSDSRGNSRCKDVVNTVVYVTVKDIHRLEVTGVGNVTVEGLNTQEMTVQFDGVGDLVMDVSCEKFLIVATGVGNVYLSGSANNATIEYDGVGDIRAYEFKVHNMNAINSGVGNMYIYADETLVIDSDGIGDVRYQGSPDVKELHFTGVGTLQSESGEGDNKAPGKGDK